MRSSDNEVNDADLEVKEPILDVEYSHDAVQQILEWAVNKVAIDQIKRHCKRMREPGRKEEDLVASIKVEIGEATFGFNIPPVRCFIQVDCGDNWYGRELTQSVEDSGKRYASFTKIDPTGKRK